MLIARISLACSFALLSFGLAACGTSKTDGADDSLPPIDAPKEGDGNDGQDAPVAIKIGEVASAKGDVLKDENGMFSLTKVFSFEAGKQTSLQIRKSYANGNCGSPTATFAVLKGEESIADVTIDPAKEYNGVPTEALPKPVAAGSYMLVAFITLDQECKDMMFYYDFYLEEKK